MHAGPHSAHIDAMNDDAAANAGRQRLAGAPCTWQNGCCARHPSAKVCARPRARHSQPPVAVAAAAAEVETPEQREASILALRRDSQRRETLERKFQPTHGRPLFYWSPLANLTSRDCARLAAADAAARPPRPLPPLQVRSDLAALLQAEGKTRGCEVGVKKGRFAHALLGAWPGCASYTLVDLWQSQANYRDRANVADAQQARNMRITMKRLEPWRPRLAVCRNFSTVCAARLRDGSMDFVYVDARHDYKGVLEDLLAYWPKLAPGGIMAGHDYLTAAEIPQAGVRDPSTGATEDWSVSFDGSREPRGTKGAVDDFFSSCARRQLAVTYREPVFNTWFVRK